MRRAGVQGGRRGAWRGRAAAAAAACALTNCQLVGGFEELPLACPEGTTLNGVGDQATCEPPAGEAGQAGQAGTGGDGGGRAGAGHVPPPRPWRARIGLGEYAQRLRDDAASVPSADRARLVYVDLHALYNSDRFVDAELVTFADAVLVLLNHLDVASTAAGHEGAAIVRDGTSMLPLAVRFDAARFNLDRQRDVADTLVRLANRGDANAPLACDVPAIPLLDFMYVASSDSVYNPFGDGGRGTYESGYSNIVVRRLLEAAGVLGPGQLVFDPAPEQAYAAGSVNVSASAGVFDLLAALDPATLDRPGLEAIYNQGNQEGRLLRGCVSSSNVSGSNRCIDRLKQGDEGGAIYLSLDVAPENGGAPNRNFLEARFVGPANPPGDPLVAPQGGVTPFVIDSGEGFFRLKNSMFGFFAFDDDFRLLSGSPIYRGGIDPGADPGGLFSGVGCTSCHSRFSLLFEDVLWPTVSGASGDEFAFAAKVAQDAGEWQVTFDLDWEPYGKALRSASVLEEGKEEGSLAAIGLLGMMYEYDLSSEDVAVELGLKGAADLTGRVKDLPFLQNALAAKGGVSRKIFTLYYQTLVDQADPADQDFLRGCLARQAGDLDP
jgi:hypothetical protein